MRWWLVLGLCGCNQIFGLGRTNSAPIDAVYFDAPTDAPFTCPPIGTTPHFATDPHQVVYEDCDQYELTSDGTLALLTCVGAISQGPPTGPFVAIPELASDSATQRQNVRMSPDGDQLILQEQSAGPQFVRYTHGSDGAWIRGDVLAWPSTLASSVYSVSTQTRGLPRRFLAVDNDGYLDEVIDDGTSQLQFQRRYLQGELGVFNFTQPMLSPDGLRVVLYGTHPQPDGSVLQAVWYSDRPSLDVDFRPFEALPDVPIVQDTFFAEDCSRLYFSGIGSIWYVQRL